MSTILDTPITQPDGTVQAIVGLRVNIPHHIDGGQVKIDKDKVSIHYAVVTYTSDLEEVARSQRSVPWPSWPAGFRQQMRDVYESVRQDARANGLLQPGTDEPLN